MHAQIVHAGGLGTCSICRNIREFSPVILGPVADLVDRVGLFARTLARAFIVLNVDFIPAFSCHDGPVEIQDFYQWLLLLLLLHHKMIVVIIIVIALLHRRNAQKVAPARWTDCVHVKMHTISRPFLRR